MVKIVGENVRRLMLEKGITQLVMSLKMGLDQGHLNRLLSGKVNWQEKHIVVASEILEIDPGALFRRYIKAIPESDNVIKMKKADDPDSDFRQIINYLKQIWNSGEIKLRQAALTQVKTVADLCTMEDRGLLVDISGESCDYKLGP